MSGLPPMRALFRLPLLAVGCTNPVSCEALNALRPDDAMRTCVSSASEGDDDDTITLADGSVLAPETVTYSDGTTIQAKWFLSEEDDTFPDGIRLVPTDSGDLEWRQGGETVRRDSVGEVAGPVRVHPSGRYAVPLLEGRLLLRSRDGSDPVDLPVEIVRGTAVGVWEVDSGAEVGRWDHPRTPSDIAFGDDGSLVVWFAERSTTTRREIQTRTTARSNGSATPPAIAVWRLP